MDGLEKFGHSTVTQNPSVVRTFPTGATRDTDTDKPDYFGFFSPVAMLEYGKYMHRHRKQPDGKMRESDNWAKGMPLKEYARSLERHALDLKLHMWHMNDLARESLMEALCAIIFNAQAMLHELGKPIPCCPHNLDNPKKSE